MLLLALMESAKTMLEWVDMYGADKVFMVLFFIMYLRSQKRLGKQADARLADSKEALQALIEAKHVFGELATILSSIKEKLEGHFVDDDIEFKGINTKLDVLIEQNGWSDD